MFRPTLADKNQPIVPLILRGKKKANRRHNSLLPDDPNDIRMSLDQNLHQIFQEIREKKNSIDPVRRHSLIERPPLKLNENLVKEYINFVYRQYNINDPLANISVLQPRRERWTTEKKNNFRNINQNSTNRKAVHLKQSFLIEMFSPDQDSFSQKQNQHSSIKHAKSTEISSPPKMHRYGEMSEVKDSYRYCFICEQPILQANIETHEKLRCPQFCNLYSMSIFQLKEILLRKISRIKNQISSSMTVAGAHRNSNKCAAKNVKTLEEQAHCYISKVDECILQDKSNKQNAFINQQSSLQGRKIQIKNQFQSVMHAFDKQYFSLYSDIRKLQWFMSMYFNLENRFSSVLNQTVKRDSVSYREVPRRMSLAH